MNFLTEYQKLPSEECGDSFVGMNSGKGFLGTYDTEICEEELKKLYIIKGAAGTGKSSFMKKLYFSAAKKGITCERLACSSDYKSLDCVILNRSIAVLDGTMPHALEMRYPGAISELIDVTKFWDGNRLKDRRDDIIFHTNKKKGCYDEAYLGLKSYMILQYERVGEVDKALDREKMVRNVSRLVKGFGRSHGDGNVNRKIYRAVGMTGKVRLDTLETHAKSIIKVADIYGSAYVFMNSLKEELLKNSWDVTVSYDPISPDLICDLYIPQLGTLITVDDAEQPEKIINMGRFINNDILSKLRGSIKLSKKCGEVILNDVLQSLSEAGESHFELERIYGSAMNFDCLSSYFDIKAKEIIDEV